MGSMAIPDRFSRASLMNDNLQGPHQHFLAIFMVSEAARFVSVEMLVRNAAKNATLNTWTQWYLDGLCRNWDADYQMVVPVTQQLALRILGAKGQAGRKLIQGLGLEGVRGGY